MSENNEIDSNIYMYNFTTISWNVLDSNLNNITPSIQPEIFTYKNYLFVVGGMDYKNNIFNRILRTNLDNSPLIFEEVNIGNFTVNFKLSLVLRDNTIYIFGGLNNGYSNSISYLIIDIENNSLNLSYTLDGEVFPEERIYSSLHAINSNLGMFGGHDKKTFYNRLWIFDLITLTWTPTENKGNVPSIRTHHAAYSEGDAIVIWGGEDPGGYKNDMFMYNFITSTWHQIIAENQAPSPRVGACAALGFPKYYIFGGLTYAGVSNEAWEYDFNTNRYTQLASFDLNFYSCKCQPFKDIIYILGAHDESINGFNSIFYFNTSANTWGKRFRRTRTLNIVENISIVFPDYLVEYGGQIGNLYGNAIIDIYNDSDLIHSSTWRYFEAFAAGFVYVKTDLIIFGGGITELFIIPSHYVASNRFMSVQLLSVAKENNLKLHCSEGSYLQDNITCEFCPEGTYSDELGYNKCKQCPQGTFNNKLGSTSKRQCYPCPEGYYTDKIGSNQCLLCPFKLYCPIGSISPTDFKPSYKEESIQPKSYKISRSSLQISVIYLYSASISIAIIILVLISILKTRRIIKKIDVFINKHENKIDSALILRKTLIGGIFTVSFIAIALILFGMNFIQFLLLNVEENKSLQPISVFEQEVTNFTADFNVTVSLYYYGGECNGISENTVKIISSSMNKGSLIQKAEKENYICKISYLCKKCMIASELKLTFKSIEDNCYTKAISVHISSESSIPESYSIMTKTIESSKNKTYIGNSASKFYYSFTPSVFYSSLEEFTSSQTGYHLTEYSPPIEGSSHTIDELAEVYGLKVEVNLDKRNFGLYTERYPKQSAFIIASAVIGSISGIFSVVSFSMSIVEKVIRIIKEKRKLAKKIPKILKKRQRLEVFTIEYEHYNLALPKLLKSTDSVSFSKKKTK